MGFINKWSGSVAESEVEKTEGLARFDPSALGKGLGVPRPPTSATNHDIFFMDDYRIYIFLLCRQNGYTAVADIPVLVTALASPTHDRYSTSVWP